MIDISIHFKDLIFKEESHTYWLDDKQLPSVSSLLKKFAIPFDEKNALKYSAKKLGVSEQSLKESWTKINKEACDKGHTIHEFAELYNNDCLKPSRIEELAVIQYYMNLPKHILPLFVELRVYYKDLYAGTFDGLMYNTLTGKYILYDWKTNKDIHKNYNNQMLLSPFDDLLDTPLHKYYIQLNLYKKAIEQYLEIEHMEIVYLKPNIDNYPMLYQTFTVPNLEHKLKQYFNET